jgi:hypothetical protein
MGVVVRAAGRRWARRTAPSSSGGAGVPHERMLAAENRWAEDVRRLMAMTSLAPAARGFCRSCGYSLEGIQSARCPECGREFDPSNWETMRHPRTLDESYGRAPGRVVLALTVVAVVSTVLAYASPEPNAFFRKLGEVMWLIAAVSVGMRVACRWVIPARLLPGRAEWRVFARRVSAFLLTFVVVWLLVVIRVPLVVRLWVSLPSLYRAVARARERPGGTRGVEEWIGAFPVIAVFQPDGAVGFPLREFSGTIVYAPDGPPVIYHGAGGYVFELELARIWGDWYTADWKALP